MIACYGYQLGKEKKRKIKEKTKQDHGVKLYNIRISCKRMLIYILPVVHM